MKPKKRRYPFLSLLYLFLQKKHFQWRKSKQISFIDKTVISIGNLTVGGSGKTPICIYLLDKLIEAKIPTLVVLRGYRGKMSKKGSLVGKTSSAQMVGDEAVEIYHEISRRTSALDCYQVAICRNRSRMIQKYGKLSEVILLDDAMQNPTIYHDLEITLLDSNIDYEKEELLPYGRLREPLSALRRSNIILELVPPLAYSNGLLRSKRKEKMLQLSQHLQSKTKKYRFEKNCAGWFKVVNPTKKCSPNKKFCAVFCGIGQPQSLLANLRNSHHQIIFQRIFPDHYHYTLKDMGDLAVAIPQQCDIITTQKDWTKLQPIHQQIIQDQKKNLVIDQLKDFFSRLYVCQQKIRIDHETDFLQDIFEKIAKKQEKLKSKT